MSDAQKRWDQFGPYTLERRDTGTHTLPPPVSAAIPISFGDRGRIACLSSTCAAITVVGRTGYLALALDHEHGLCVEITPERARAMAANLTRMALHLEGKAA